MSSLTNSTLDVHAIRQEFPVLHQHINGKPLVYFDNAATSQKPRVVIEALKQYYEQYNANIHRGAHHLAVRATEAYEQSREAARRFLNASSTDEILFVRGVTEAVNLVADCLSRSLLQEGDEVLISAMEHHSNIVPWQMACERTGATLKVIPVKENGELDTAQADALLSARTKVLSVVHISNALGSINPVKELIRKAKARGALTFIDGAQGAVHLPIDVQDLDCDFYAFSGHKVYAPTGIGVLYGRRSVLEKLPPYHGGGEMIKEVTFEKTTYNELPFKYEAGTPNIADAIALRYAIEFVEQIGKEAMLHHEQALLHYATDLVSRIDGLQVIGQAKEKAGILSFVIEGVHHHDIGVLLDNMGVAIRTGHHCTQPLMRCLGLEGTSRASFAVYNTPEEVERFAEALKKAANMLR
ncbi:cysteine desulfurase/selenocysteine lyase [Thermonema lapsum]|uniref:Cysteine desulfurase n=1 Tax=Thermonema lapsum TaxID=28195 RepID=A0A846MQX2_9BACT|nr:cysteine desulfurase [Thermonema lapsum]NIK74058.1 cysteine desulfurase/selenocysteine lyase [Thermonema lapsum]